MRLSTCQRASSCLAEVLKYIQNRLCFNSSNEEVTLSLWAQNPSVCPVKTLPSIRSAFLKWQQNSSQMVPVWGVLVQTFAVFVLFIHYPSGECSLLATHRLPCSCWLGLTWQKAGRDVWGFCWSHCFSSTSLLGCSDSITYNGPADSCRPAEQGCKQEADLTDDGHSTSLPQIFYQDGTVEPGLTLDGPYIKKNDVNNQPCSLTAANLKSPISVPTGWQLLPTVLQSCLAVQTLT